MLEWRTFCGGLVLGGFCGGKARVGICGPHPNGYCSVSFYERPMQSRREIFVRRKERGIVQAEGILAIMDRVSAGLRTSSYDSPTEPGN